MRVAVDTSRWRAGTWSVPALPGAAALRRIEGATMGTTWSVVLEAPFNALDALHARVQAVLDQVVAQMSPWRADSAITRFNDADAGTSHVLPDAFAHVLDAALALARDTHGAFDPTAGALVDAWGFGPPGPVAHWPDDARIDALRVRCGWQRLAFDQDTRIAVQPGGMRLDLSAIAKGFGVDQIVDALRDAGVASALVEVGGELRGLGRKPDGTAWTVAVEGVDEGAHAARLVLGEHAIATSGDYRRFDARGDARIAHTLDPRSGRPVAHALATTTVLHASAMQADALATALMVLGPVDGIAFANRHGLAALLLVREGVRIVPRATPAFVAAQRAA